MKTLARSSPESLFARQLNLNDLPEAAISMPPNDGPPCII